MRCMGNFVECVLTGGVGGGEGAMLGEFDFEDIFQVWMFFGMMVWVFWFGINCERVNWEYGRGVVMWKGKLK